MPVVSLTASAETRAPSLSETGESRLRPRVAAGRAQPSHPRRPYTPRVSSPDTSADALAGPCLIAHRAANDLASLRAAEQQGARIVEADVYLHRGRLEIRHLKTAGLLPVLWDRWRLASAFAPRLLLPDLLGALGPSTELVLDLKGRDPRLAQAVLDVLDAAPRRPDLTVCARRWRLLETFHGRDDVQVVHSVGSPQQLDELRRRGGDLAGVSIHERLLSPALVRELTSRAGLVLTWPVNTPELARRLLDWGVTGLISDRFALLAGELGAPDRGLCPTS